MDTAEGSGWMDTDSLPFAVVLSLAHPSDIDTHSILTLTRHPDALTQVGDAKRPITQKPF